MPLYPNKNLGIYENAEYKDFSPRDITSKNLETMYEVQRRREKLQNQISEFYDVMSKTQSDFKNQDEFEAILNDIMTENKSKIPAYDVPDQIVDTINEMERRIKISPDYLKRNIPQATGKNGILLDYLKGDIDPDIMKKELDDYIKMGAIKKLKRI